MDNQVFLYVEDDSLSREVMSMIVGMGMGVSDLTIFEDSTNFMQRLKALPKKPTMIMLDIHMQPHTGFEMLEMLRSDADYKDTKVVALTASVMNEEVQRLRESGFDGAIGKPLSIQTFSSLLERIINGEIVWHIA